MSLSEKQLSTLLEKIINIQSFIYAALLHPHFDAWLSTNPSSRTTIESFSKDIKAFLGDEGQQDTYRQLIKGMPSSTGRVEVKQRWMSFLWDKPILAAYLWVSIGVLEAEAQKWESFRNEPTRPADGGAAASSAALDARSIAGQGPSAGAATSPAGRHAAQAAGLLGGRAGQRRARSVYVEGDAEVPSDSRSRMRIAYH